MADPRQTGKDTEVSINGTTLAYTTTTFDIPFETDSSDMNDRPTPTTAVYSRYMEGTMEWDGTQVEVHDALINANGSQTEDISLRITDTEKVYRATEVTLTNISVEHPADGKSNGTIDWRADDYRRE